MLSNLIFMVIVSLIQDSKSIMITKSTKLRLFSLASGASSSIPLPVGLSSSCIVPMEQWRADAEKHAAFLDNLLYPPYESSRTMSKKTALTHQSSIRTRSHQIADHPIYNFLHHYYQYSAENLRKYSPGFGIILEGADQSTSAGLLDGNSVTFSDEGGVYDIHSLFKRISNKKAWERFVNHRDILAATTRRPAFFGCFGMHEWAMLYSGNGTQVKGHQPQLSLRVSQETIDALVGTPGQLRCTHFDAYRFFQPAAKPLNAISPLTRAQQPRYEQPACIHANMDLFRYAYSLYPFVSSALLVATLQLALEARKVDMRASPYDVSAFPGCEVPICVETAQGRKLYVAEQERIASLASPIRKQLCDVYDFVMGSYLSYYGDKLPHDSATQVERL